MNEKNTYDDIDPRLKAMFEELRQVPTRDPRAAEMGRSRFMKEVDILLQEYQPEPKPTFLQLVKEKLTMKNRTFAGRAGMITLLAVVALVAFVFGTMTMTAYAARSALPGDALYGVKTGLENTQANLSNDSATKVELYLEFASRRLEEIAKLIQDERYADIQLATAEFQEYIQKALDAATQLSASDPVKAAEWTAKINAKLGEFALILGGFMADVPDDAARVELEKALQVSSGGAMEVKQDGEVEFVATVEQINGDTWVIGGKTVKLTPQTEIKGAIVVGSQVKVHAILNGDGTFTAREIELLGAASGNDNQNGNANEDNGNSNDDNGNANTNQNEANENESMNGNTNDDSQNGNTNDNGSGSNSNDGGSNSNDDQGGSNDNSGSNDNGDDGGKNDNDKNDND